MKFSKSTLGFYQEGMSSFVPSDAVTITDEKYKDLIVKISQGKTLSADSSGNPVAIDPVIPTDQLKPYFVNIVQSFLDSKAQERGYDGIQSAALRAALPNSPFHDEGVAYGEWMDNCWVRGYQLLAAVQAGGAMPTVQQVIDSMPTLTLPERDIL